MMVSSSQNAEKLSRKTLIATSTKVVFCHGLETGPVGAKSLALRAAGFNLVAPDCRGIALAGRVEVIEAVVEELERPVVVGSSYGGIAALCAAVRLAERGVSLRGLLLCAPALLCAEPPADSLDLRPVCATVIVHGTKDSVIPVVSSRVFAREHGVPLVEVEDDHGLAHSLDQIVALVSHLMR
ncbi:MAG: alpha/beta hydrolase [Planctomycetota bacterium]